MVREEGEASIRVELRDGVIKVYHGTDKNLLFKKVAKSGDWDKIWKAIGGRRSRKLKKVM